MLNGKSLEHEIIHTRCLKVTKPLLLNHSQPLSTYKLLQMVQVWYIIGNRFYTLLRNATGTDHKSVHEALVSVQHFRGPSLQSSMRVKTGCFGLFCCWRDRPIYLTVQIPILVRSTKKALSTSLLFYSSVTVKRRKKLSDVWDDR